MTELELAQAYFDAWNAQDADAIVATFCDAGTYTDPTTNGTLSGPAIGAYAKGLWDAFPDLSFEIRSLAETAANLSPDKTVLLPDKTAGCPLADMITAKDLAELKSKHPDALVVSYVSTWAGM